jgi:Apea-like HEPN
MWHGSRVTESPRSVLADLARHAYARSDPAAYKDKGWESALGVITTPDRSQLMRLAIADCQFYLDRAVAVLSEEPILSIFQPSEGQFGPTLLYPGGGRGQPFSEFVAGLFVCAAQRFYFLGEDSTLAEFFEAVMENYDALLSQGRGEPIPAYDLIGFTGIRLAAGTQVVTPWGVLRPAPSNFRIRFGAHATTAILVAPRTITLAVSRDEFPAPLSTGDSAGSNVEGVKYLLPLAFALAASGKRPHAPMITFETVLLPLVELNSYRMPDTMYPTQAPAIVDAHQLLDVEVWAGRLEASRNGALQVAERRIVSAIAQRSDSADSLIDAVVAWESLVGSRAETVFRVTASLAILLESRSELRPALQKKLKKVYDIRSRVIHGELAAGDDVFASSIEAIEIGLQALRVLHDRSGDWLTMKSGQRSERLILDN